MRLTPYPRGPMAYAQQDQPEGVPPLELTGERTLPDVPEENYWYRRHVVVYEWIAERCEGKRVVDLACGEGYGSDLLAEREGGDRGRRQPRGPPHARRRYSERTSASSAASSRSSTGKSRRRLPADDRAHRGSRRAARADRAARAGRLHLDPQPAHAGPPGREEVRNPWHIREYDATEYRALWPPTSTGRAAGPVPRRQAARARARARRAGTASTRRPPEQALLRPLHPGDRSADFELAETDLDGALDFVGVCER